MRSRRACALLLAAWIGVHGMGPGVWTGAWRVPAACAGDTARDAHFNAMVKLAIDRGADYLHQRMSKGTPRGAIAQQYAMGIRALPLYALLESGVSVDSSLVTRLLSELRQIEPKEVYSVACYIMALDALQRHAPAESAEKPPEPGRTGVSPTARQRSKIRGAIHDLVQWMVNARSIPRGTWGYHAIGSRDPTEWVDFSNTQFAVLALQVGLRNEVAIPDKVFREIVFALEKCAMPRTDGAGEVACQGAGWWTDSKVTPDKPQTSRPRGTTRVTDPPPEIPQVEMVSGGFVLSGRPLEWPYRPQWQVGEGRNRAGYGMLAAGTSSLMVAREGLARSGNMTEAERRKIDALIAGGVIALDRGYSSLGAYPPASLFGNGYYDLYSFEKAMDLGGIAELGEHDWYREQALELIAAQRKNGGWGGDSYAGESEYDIVSTSFALLFLKRATRSLRIEPFERVITGEGARESDVAKGKLFLASLNGLVDLRELFDALAAERTSRFLELAREAVASAPPEQLPELLPYLSGARNGTRDAVDEFAGDRIAEISGLAATAPKERVHAWLVSWRRIQELAAARDEQRVGEVIALLEDRESTGLLQVAAIDGLARLGSLDGVPALLGALTSVRFEVRERAVNALRFLTRHDEPFDVRANGEQLRAEAKRWQEYWVENEGELRFRISWGRLSQALNRAEQPGERDKLRSRLIALGRRALPEVEKELSRERFPFDWLLVFEAISGERRGL